MRIGPARVIRSVAIAVVALAAVVSIVAAVAGDRRRVGVAESAASAYSAAPEVTATPARPTVTLPADVALYVVGDSYTFGQGASERSKGWAAVVARALGGSNRIDGVRGTGFTYEGPNGRDQRYSTRISALIAASTFKPNLVILQGGQNDYRSPVTDIAEAVTAEVQQLQAAFPGVQVVVFGPVAPEPLVSTLDDIDDAVRSGAQHADVPYVSPVAGNWITASNSDGFRADDAHLNDAGHAYLARRFLTALRGLSRG